MLSRFRFGSFLCFDSHRNTHYDIFPWHLSDNVKEGSLANSIPPLKNRAKSDTTFQMLLFELKSCAKVSEILEELKKDPERHGGPPDCIAS
ncbi:damage-control phosphatase At2g17340-like [Brassica napus]|uniref:damage-control phosphatase At2g17340-like n=1 Tax=Brassica napus TaxID=3708 RepID=UPI002078EDD7|nr:damage-control phosphatase At2g17340-like [Brassica napus]